LLGLAAAVGIVAGFVLSMEKPARFNAPGVHAFEVREPGRYVVWHEGRDLPAESSITVIAPDGKPVPVDVPGSQTWSDSSITRTAAAKFTADVPGRYAVEVSGPFALRTMAVSPDFMGAMFGAIAAAILAAILGVAGGITMAVIVFARRNERPATATVLPAKDSEKSLRELTTVVYALQAVSFLFGITLIAGVIINYLKRGDVAGTWLESHFRWQIRTFWWVIAWGVIGFVTAIIVIGFLVWLLAAVWFVYRIVKGWLRLNDAQPVG
jgi:uncharacterized membrane protein